MSLPSHHYRSRDPQGHWGEPCHPSGPERLLSHLICMLRGQLSPAASARGDTGGSEVMGRFQDSVTERRGLTLQPLWPLCLWHRVAEASQCG